MEQVQEMEMDFVVGPCWTSILAADHAGKFFFRSEAIKKSDLAVDPARHIYCGNPSGKNIWVVDAAAYPAEFIVRWA